jgi:hypothetical protein
MSLMGTRWHTYFLVCSLFIVTLIIFFHIFCRLSLRLYACTAVFNCFLFPFFSLIRCLCLPFSALSSVFVSFLCLLLYYISLTLSICPIIFLLVFVASCFSLFTYFSPFPQYNDGLCNFLLPNVVVKWLTLCFIFGRSRVQISVRRPTH